MATIIESTAIEQQCSICLETRTDQETSGWVTHTGAGGATHSFHRVCLDHWIAESRRYPLFSCPNCRAECRVNQVAAENLPHQIFNPIADVPRPRSASLLLNVLSAAVIGTAIGICGVGYQKFIYEAFTEDLVIATARKVTSAVLALTIVIPVPFLDGAYSRMIIDVLLRGVYYLGFIVLPIFLLPEVNAAFIGSTFFGVITFGSAAIINSIAHSILNQRHLTQTDMANISWGVCLNSASLVVVTTLGASLRFPAAIATAAFIGGAATGVLSYL